MISHLRLALKNAVAPVANGLHFTLRGWVRKVASFAIDGTAHNPANVGTYTEIGGADFAMRRNMRFDRRCAGGLSCGEFVERDFQTAAEALCVTA
jgi:hypothetical protein